MTAASRYQHIEHCWGHADTPWRAHLVLRGNARKVEHQAARKLWPARRRVAALPPACAQVPARPPSRSLPYRVSLCCTLTRSRGCPRLRMV